MQNTLYPKKLDGSCQQTLDCVIKLYELSFPQHERRTTLDFVQTLNHPALEFCSWHDRTGQLCALSSLWQHAHFAYLEYLAISPEHQGCGLGSAILQMIIDNNSKKPLILDIDPPIDTPSRRRLSFYEKMHFHVNHQFSFKHPPYQAGQQPFDMLVLSRPKPLEAELFAEFCLFHRNSVVAGATQGHLL